MKTTVTLEEKKARYRAAAKSMQADGELEVAWNAKVSLGDDEGAYVQVWIWVPDEKVFTPDELAEMAAPIECAWCRSRNIAHQSGTGGVWECHDCGKEFDMRDLDLDAHDLKEKYGDLGDEHPLATRKAWETSDKKRDYWEWAETKISILLEGLLHAS